LEVKIYDLEKGKVEKDQIPNPYGPSNPGSPGSVEVRPPRGEGVIKKNPKPI